MLHRFPSRNRLTFIPRLILAQGAGLRVRGTCLEPRTLSPEPSGVLGRVLLLAGIVVMLAGCATVSPQQTAEILWPAPPETARIKFLGLLRNQDDLRALQGGKGGRQWFEEALLGPKKVTNALQQPMGLALSRSGARLYVTDYAKPDVLVFDFEKRTVRSLGGNGGGCQSPLGIAVDAADNVYVVDSTPKQIRVFSPSEAALRSITHESLVRPTGIAVDDARNRLYVADSATAASEQHVIRVFDLAGTYLKALGEEAGAAGPLAFPTYLTLDPQGNLYVADTMNARVQVFDAEGRYVKTIGERGDAYGMFDKPKGVALDSFGNLYVVDSSWSNVQIFNPRGEILLYFGGRGKVPGLLFNPTGITIGAENRIFVADAFNQRVAMYQLINTTAEDSFPSRASQRSNATEATVRR